MSTTKTKNYQSLTMTELIYNELDLRPNQSLFTLQQNLHITQKYFRLLFLTVNALVANGNLQYQGLSNKLYNQP